MFIDFGWFILNYKLASVLQIGGQEKTFIDNKIKQIILFKE